MGNDSDAVQQYTLWQQKRINRKNCKRQVESIHLNGASLMHTPCTIQLYEVF